MKKRVMLKEHVNGSICCWRDKRKRERESTKQDETLSACQKNANIQSELGLDEKCYTSVKAY